MLIRDLTREGAAGVARGLHTDHQSVCGCVPPHPLLHGGTASHCVPCVSVLAAMSCSMAKSLEPRMLEFRRARGVQEAPAELQHMSGFRMKEHFCCLDTDL